MENPSSAAEEIGSGNNSTLPKCDGGRGSDGFPHSDSVPGDEYTVNVTQLDPGAMYVFCVGYSSGKFMSDWSASQELSTLDGESASRVSEWLRLGACGCMEAPGWLAGCPDLGEAACMQIGRGGEGRVEAIDLLCHCYCRQNTIKRVGFR